MAVWSPADGQPGDVRIPPSDRVGSTAAEPQRAQCPAQGGRQGVGPCTTIKPLLLSRSTTGEFNTPPDFSVDAGAAIKPLLMSRSAPPLENSTRYFPLFFRRRPKSAEDENGPLRIPYFSSRRPFATKEFRMSSSCPEITEGPETASWCCF
eukprot:328989-Prorocentrum_minimum.AAC.1